MHRSDRISLRLVDDGVASKRQPQSEIVIDGRPSGHVVGGLQLESVIDCGDRWLLFLTDDVMYEEALSIYLCEREGRVLDSAQLGAPYATGILEDLQLIEPNFVRFNFFRTMDHTIEIFPEPRVYWQWLSYSCLLARPLRLRRHFAVRCVQVTAAGSDAEGSSQPR
jgi:hypothetical protein